MLIWKFQSRLIQKHGPMLLIISQPNFKKFEENHKLKLKEKRRIGRKTCDNAFVRTCGTKREASET